MKHRIAKFALIILAVIGLKLYFKSSNHDDIKKTYLEEVCTNDRCRQLVNEHFDSCFEANYEIGGYRRSNKFDQKNFENCIAQ